MQRESNLTIDYRSEGFHHNVSRRNLTFELSGCRPRSGLALEETI